MRISDWSSDVCSSDLKARQPDAKGVLEAEIDQQRRGERGDDGGAVALLQQPGIAEDEKGAAEHEADQQDEAVAGPHDRQKRREIGRASCRERVCQYV